MHKVVPWSLCSAARLGHRCAWLAAAALVLVALPARAQQQLVVVDAMYTATAQNTTDSHYRVAPLSGTPNNWRSPVDYASGTAYVRFEVVSKPSSLKTLFNVCFEGNQAACMGYPPPYTAPGTYDFSYAFNTFWQYGAVEWNKGIKNVALILKNEAGDKVQADPKFYPTTIHVVITLVPPGGKYVPPMLKDAGAPDAGKQDAGPAADAAPPADNDAEVPMDAAEPPLDAAVTGPADADAAPVMDSAGAGAGSAAGGAANAGSPRREPGMITLYAADAMPNPPVHTASGSCSVNPRATGSTAPGLLLLFCCVVRCVFRRRLARD